MRSASRGTGGAAPAEVALGDVEVDLRQLALDDAERPGERGSRRPSARERKSRSAIRRPSRSTGGDVARVVVGVGERVVQRADREGDGVRVARARRAGSARRARRCGGAGTLRRKAWKPPTACSSASAWPSRRCASASSPSSVGSATRSIRSTMSAASIAAPASQEGVRLVAQHRPVGHAPEQAAALLDERVDRVRAGAQRAGDVAAQQREVERVDRLPHLGAEDVAHGARALAGAW